MEKLSMCEQSLNNTIIVITNAIWAVVVVKWSVCLPFTPTIRVRSPLKSTIFSVKFVFERNENKQKRGRGLPI